MSVKSQESNMRRLSMLLSHDLSFIGGERECGPNGSKKAFLNTGKAFLRALARDLGLHDVTVSANSGGIAVSGECTLIGMWETGGIYVCLYQSAGGGNDVLLYRTVRHCRDYKGGYNRFLSRRDLEGGSYAHLLETLSRLRKDRVDEMSEPLELQAQRPYALDQLTMLQSQIMQTIQGMVVLRARIEKQRRSNIEAARDTYTELDRARERLIEQLSKSELFLLEMEEYPLASAADQLRHGLAGFNLMSMGYKPIYEALAKFTASFPTGQKTNAAIIGRLMNNIKLGYYPTDPDHISLILRGIRFPEGVTTNLFDPCCGCGKALRQLAQGNNCYAYGVELDESRAEEAQTRLHRVGFGSFFHSRISHEAFHLLFLNPPYLSVINESGGRSRHEKAVSDRKHSHADVRRAADLCYSLLPADLGHLPHSRGQF